MARTWKKISQKTLLTHPRLTVYEDTVLLPSGHQTDYIHFGKKSDGAMIVAIGEDGKILVQKEYSYPPNEWLYQFPGGALEKGETIEQGALRELAEEAKLKGTLKKIGWYYLDNRRRQDKMHVFVATELSSNVMEKDLEEEFETYWFTEKEIDKLIRDGKIINYTMLSGWAIYKATK